MDPLGPALAAIVTGAGGGADGARTEKVAGLLVPPGVVTVTFRSPAMANESIDNVAVTLVALATLIAAAVTPVPLIATAAPLVKLFPVSVTFTDVPMRPVEGAIEFKVGAAGRIGKARPLLAPPPVATVILRMLSTA